MIRWCPVIPLWFGNAPVPIVAWSCAVLVGDEPTLASWNHVPFSIRESRYGCASGHSSSTFMPPASQTIVTTSFGVAVGVLDGLVHGLAVDRLEAVEVQELRDRRSDAREGDGPLHAHARRHEPGAVPEHRHVLDVVPRTDVRQPGADEVGLERDVGELRAAIRAPAPPRPQEELVGDRACEAHQVLVARLRARGQARHGDGGGHEQAESEREQEEALRGHWATSVPDLAPNDNRGGSLDDVASGRRLIMLVVAMALVGAPAVALTAFCVGESCAPEDGVATAVPFCPLPADLRAGIEAGFRQGRSPDVMAATAGTEVVTIVDGTPVSWPSTSPHDARVPIVFWGAGVSDAPLPDGTGLDQIAPTLASILSFDRPHPQVRAGVAVDGVASGQRPRLVVVIAMKGVGTAAFEAKRATRRSIRDLTSEGAGTLEGSTGSLPLDPAASLTTIGTGALPTQHGITASFVRNDKGELTPAWGDDAPLSVVSTLAEDLDRHFGERSSIGLVARDASDRGLVGGSWYPEHDHDDVRVGGRPARVGRLDARSRVRRRRHPRPDRRLARRDGGEDDQDDDRDRLPGAAGTRPGDVRPRRDRTGIDRHDGPARSRTMSTPRSALLW